MAEIVFQLRVVADIGWRSQEHHRRRPHGAERKDGGRNSSRSAGWRFLRANGIPEGRRQM